MFQMTRVHVCVLAGSMLLVACGRGDRYASTDSVGATTSPGLARAPSAGASSGAGQGMTDANIVSILDQANVADSTRGALAATKGTSADVKAFGKVMMGEHHALREQGQSLAKQLSVTPQPLPGDQSEQQAKQELDSLQAMPKGNAWDRAYIDYEVTYHQQVIETATKALDAAQSPELKALIQKAAPVLQKHLDRAKEIQGKLKS